MEMACDLFKEIGKFSVIIWVFSKFIKEDGYDCSNDSNQGTVKIISIRSSSSD